MDVVGYLGIGDDSYVPALSTSSYRAHTNTRARARPNSAPDIEDERDSRSVADSASDSDATFVAPVVASGRDRERDLRSHYAGKSAGLHEGNSTNAGMPMRKDFMRRNMGLIILFTVLMIAVVTLIVTTSWAREPVIIRVKMGRVPPSPRGTGDGDDVGGGDARDANASCACDIDVQVYHRSDLTHPIRTKRLRGECESQNDRSRCFSVCGVHCLENLQRVHIRHRNASVRHDGTPVLVEIVKGKDVLWAHAYRLSSDRPSAVLHVWE